MTSKSICFAAAFALAEFRAARGPDYRYKSLLGDRDPPLDYRD